VLPVGPPVRRARQIGREGDIVRLAYQVRAGEHTVLADRRRTGKTTVALGALDLLANDGWVIVAIELSDLIASCTTLAEAIAAQVAVQERRPEASDDLGYELWERIQPSIGFGEEDMDAIDRALEVLRASGSGSAQLTWALDYAATAGRAGEGVAIFLDEIQRLEWWADHGEVAAELSGRMRQPDGEITFLFAGSEPSLVKSLFGKDGLLEHNALEFQLSPIDHQPWREGLRRAFKELGLTITDVAVDLILAASEGRPHRTMLAANRTAETTQFAELTEADTVAAEQGVVAARANRLWDAEEGE
jgi:hypothetical protein